MINILVIYATSSKYSKTQNYETLISCWKLETIHTLRERMKRKRDNKLIEDFVFFHST
jgi:hypothetical protein